MPTERNFNPLFAFENMESNVRSYSRSFPVVFRKAVGDLLEDEKGSVYIDFLSGAGALNYGHNDPGLLPFMEHFDAIIRGPRDLRYKLQFPGPTGANAVEAALKLARKATGRHTVISFSYGYHGVSLGALAVTGSPVTKAAVKDTIRTSQVEIQRVLRQS